MWNSSPDLSSFVTHWLKITTLHAKFTRTKAASRPLWRMCQVLLPILRLHVKARTLLLLLVGLRRLSARWSYFRVIFCKKFPQSCISLHTCRWIDHDLVLASVRVLKYPSIYWIEVVLVYGRLDLSFGCIQGIEFAHHSRRVFPSSWSH